MVSQNAHDRQPLPAKLKHPKSGKQETSFVVILCLILLTVARSNAMSITSFRTDSGGYYISLSGKIQTGDNDKLGQLLTKLNSIDASAPILGFALDSPGGSLLEAELLANNIKNFSVPVVMLKNQVCASACFLIFAAATKRIVQPGASIGVHSASQGGEESFASMGFTTLFARALSGYGVPSDIIGELVSTPPDQIKWLSIAEMQEMGVQFLTPEPDAIPESLRQPDQSQPDRVPRNTTSDRAVAATPQSLKPAAEAPSDPAEEGLRDRQEWEKWFASLDPVAHDGANFWASQRSLKSPASCLSQISETDEWQQACLEARRRLLGSDQRRRSEVTYKAGWNSFVAQPNSASPCGILLGTIGVRADLHDGGPAYEAALVAAATEISRAEQARRSGGGSYKIFSALVGSGADYSSQILLVYLDGSWFCGSGGCATEAYRWYNGHWVDLSLHWMSHGSIFLYNLKQEFPDLSLKPTADPSFWGVRYYDQRKSFNQCPLEGAALESK